MRPVFNVDTQFFQNMKYDPLSACPWKQNKYFFYRPCHHRPPGNKIIIDGDVKGTTFSFRCKVIFCRSLSFCEGRRKNDFQNLKNSAEGENEGSELANSGQSCITHCVWQTKKDRYHICFLNKQMGRTETSMYFFRSLKLRKPEAKPDRLSY